MQNDDKSYTMKITDTQLTKRYYQALLERDPQYLGVFYAGITSTGIVCLSTCRARKPKPQNVQFYSNLQDAIKAGFRPCKIGRPTEHGHSAPELVKQALKLLQGSDEKRLSDADLRHHHLSPEAIRRWFKQHYKMTFQAYQRMLRINQAMNELKQGESATHAALNNGYESLSGFSYTFKKLTGKSPMTSNSNNMIYIDRFTTPLGPMFICATEQGICLLEFTDRRMLEREFTDLQKRLKTTIIAGQPPLIEQAKQQIGDYFSGTLQQFDLPLHTPGSDFQNMVWQELQQIPYGQTRSYKQQAQHIGRPQSVRAVANANGMNRIAIIIPCHRVIGSNGSLTGYAGGLARKKWLLEHESNSSSNSDAGNKTT
ncbi:MAG: Bifunctional transcriptional activator/DNA repair enzyme Ada [Candidatus Celerinatantimonas neptuna]|nr:MAG: Bifunctional transcriptional activator/DNA repair enzyme Ada [Candidatus Celerinatantimonas neptuna]